MLCNLGGASVCRATFWHDKRERHSDFHSSPYMKAVMSKLSSLVAQSLIPESQRMRNRYVSSCVPESARQFRRVCSLPCCFQPLHAFVWLPQKWTWAILLHSFFHLAVNSEKWHFATLCLVGKSLLIWNTFRIGKAGWIRKKNRQKIVTN